MKRWILHVDMDAFFAAVEVRDNPALSGKPLIIGALPSERGVVSTCSYEARTFGVHSGMSIKEAYRLCPDGIYMHGNFPKYQAVSDELHRILREYTDQTLFIALDEGYLDITGSLRLFGSAETIGRQIKDRILQTTRLTCSVGIGYNMMSAKLASEEKKPNGFFVIPDEAFLMQLIANRPVKVLNGIGSKTAAVLQRYQIRCVRDLWSWSLPQLEQILGQTGRELFLRSHGVDERVIPTAQAAAKSYGKEVTYQQDLTELSDMESCLRLIARRVSIGLQRQKLWCRTVTLKFKYDNLQLHTRSRTLSNDTNDADVLFETAASLLREARPIRPVRLLGISTAHFTAEPTQQLSLTEDSARQQKKKKLNDSLLSLYDRFGSSIIKTGREIESEQRLEEMHPDSAPPADR